MVIKLVKWLTVGAKKDYLSLWILLRQKKNLLEKTEIVGQREFICEAQGKIEKDGEKKI